MPNFPFPSVVINAHAAIAALQIHRIATASFSSAIIRSVDARAEQARGAADENDVACAHGDKTVLEAEPSGERRMVSKGSYGV